jgi:hypothetical protein
MIKWLLGIMLLGCVTGCGCAGVQCAPCLGEPRIERINNAILEFDTSANNFKITDLDTLLLYNDLSAVNSRVPTDTSINEKMDPQIKGYQLNYNSFISDKRQSKFIKIDNLNIKTLEKGTGCCACSKYEINSIDINDTAYTINQLPILIKK